MSIMDLVRDITGNKQKDEVILGTIIDKPTAIAEGDASSEILVFRLDTLPETVFYQVVSALSADRKRGDRVRVHYHVDGGGKALVDWVEQA
jgi:hypothetical protein